MVVLVLMEFCWFVSELTASQASTGAQHLSNAASSRLQYSSEAPSNLTTSMPTMQSAHWPYGLPHAANPRSAASHGLAYPFSQHSSSYQNPRTRVGEASDPMGTLQRFSQAPHSTPLQPLQTELLPNLASAEPHVSRPDVKALPAKSAATRASGQTLPGNALSTRAVPGSTLGDAALLKAESFSAPPVTNFVRPPMHMQAAGSIAPTWVHLNNATAPEQHLTAGHLPHLRHLLPPSPHAAATTSLQQHALPPTLASSSQDRPKLAASRSQDKLPEQAATAPDQAVRQSTLGPPGIVIADASGMDPGTAVDNAIAAAQQMARRQLAARLTAGSNPPKPHTAGSNTQTDSSPRQYAQQSHQPKNDAVQGMADHASQATQPALTSPSASSLPIASSLPLAPPVTAPCVTSPPATAPAAEGLVAPGSSAAAPSATAPSAIAPSATSPARSAPIATAPPAAASEATAAALLTEASRD